MLFAPTKETNFIKILDKRSGLWYTFFKPLRKKSNGRMLGDREPLRVGMRHGRDSEWTFEGKLNVGKYPISMRDRVGTRLKKSAYNEYAQSGRFSSSRVAPQEFPLVPAFCLRDRSFYFLN